MAGTPNQFVRDLVERVVKTFFQGAIAAWTLAGPVFGATSVHAWKVAVAGSVAAGISAVMSVLSKPWGNQNSASLLPPHDHIDVTPLEPITASFQGATQAPVTVHVNYQQPLAPGGAVAPPAPAVVSPMTPIASDDYNELYDNGPLPGDPVPRIAGQVN